MKLNFKSLKRKLFGSLPGKKKNKKKSGKTNNIKNAISAALAFVLVVTVVAIIAGTGGSSGGTKTVVKYVEPVLQEGNVTLNADGTYTYLPEEGTDGFSSFTVLVESQQSNDYTVTFMSDNSVYGGAGLMAGQSVTEPHNPSKEGYTFVGWYTASEGGELVNFPYEIDSDTVLYAHYVEQIIVGFTGFTSSDGVLTLTGDVADVAAYTTSSNGDYVSVQNNLDLYFPFNQIEEFTDEHDNVFVKFPKFYMEWVLDENGYIDGVNISNAKVDDDYFIPDAFLNPSSYGATEYMYCDYFALGKYEMSGTSSQGYSKSGATVLTSITRANARAAARSYGTSADYYNGYQQLDMSQYISYNLLCMMYYQTSNIQNVWAGRTSAVEGHSWSSAEVTGTTDQVDGMNGWNTATDCVKMLGVENPYGNVNKWVDGIWFSEQAVYAHKFPQHYADSTTNAINTGITRPSSGTYNKYFKPGTVADEPHYNMQSYIFSVDASAANAYEYTGDYYFYSKTGAVLDVGGSWNNPSKAGLWFLDGSYTADLSNTFIGARLSYRPL